MVPRSNSRLYIPYAAFTIHINLANLPLRGNMPSNPDFADSYFKLHAKGSDLRARQHSLDFLWVKRFLQKGEFLSFDSNPQINIIDIGCAAGDFSRLFSPIGKVYGVEINESESIKARKVLFQVGDSYPLDVTFDLILIRGTLQHLPTSKEFFDFVATNLKSKGVLAILANPNSSSPMFKRTGTLPALNVYKGFSSNFEVFNRHSLENRLKGIEFSEIEIKYDYFRTPYARPCLDIPLGILSLLTGRNFGRPFPGNMFNWIGRRI